MSTIKVTSRILKIGEPMSNGMIMPKSTIEHAVKEWNKSQWEKYGQLQTEETQRNWSAIELSKITHKVNNVEIKDDYLVANMELIDTPNTKQLVEMLDNKKLYGTCSVMTDGDKIFDLNSVNITMNPSDDLKKFPLTRVDQEK